MEPKAYILYKYLNNRLDSDFYKVTVNKNNNIVIKNKREPWGYSQWALFLGSLYGTIYFSFVIVQKEIAILSSILLFITLLVFIIYPLRIRFQHFEIDITHNIIKYNTNILFPKIKTLVLTENTDLYFHLFYITSNGYTTYSCQLYHRKTNGKKNLLMEYNKATVESVNSFYKVMHHVLINNFPITEIGQKMNLKTKFKQ